MRWLLVLLVVLIGCGTPQYCANGTCSCPSGATCSLPCAAPPCHVDCQGASSCSGSCANGTCTCGAKASCAFTCAAPPCHVSCGGDNPRCDGECANGSCTCAPGSSCQFRCTAGPCHNICPAGSSCVVTCPNAGVAGTQDCDIPTCGAGAVTVCPDGIHLTCGAPCPPNP
jgi:hypothetical protein